MPDSQEKAVVQSFAAPGQPGQSGQLPLEMLPFGDEMYMLPPGGFSGSNASGNSLLDKLGGIDGIIKAVENAQKMFRMAQQFAPLLKMIALFFGKAKKPSSGPRRAIRKASGKRRRSSAVKRRKRLRRASGNRPIYRKYGGK
ncbi:MAG TPA: hypothetical protein VF260_08975 [Bacilli bacterium]